MTDLVTVTAGMVCCFLGLLRPHVWACPKLQGPVVRLLSLPWKYMAALQRLGLNRGPAMFLVWAELSLAEGHRHVSQLSLGLTAGSTLTYAKSHGFWPFGHSALCDFTSPLSFHLEHVLCGRLSCSLCF